MKLVHKYSYIENQVYARNEKLKHKIDSLLLFLPNINPKNIQLFCDMFSAAIAHCFGICDLKVAMLWFDSRVNTQDETINLLIRLLSLALEMQ